jgi:hypothetical protein
MLDKIKKHLNIIIIIMRHWWIVVPLISIIFYTVVISCEKNVLAFFKDIWLAENAFWKIADISYVIYMCILIMLVLLPILQPCIYQIIKSAGCSLLIISIMTSILQIIIYIPAFLWYCNIYPNAIHHIIKEIINAMIIQNAYIVLIKILHKIN